jgi:hypothetical protein
MRLCEENSIRELFFSPSAGEKKNLHFFQDSRKRTKRARALSPPRFRFEKREE